jgi:hypothetical protein
MCIWHLRAKFEFISMHTFRGSSLYHRIQNLIIYQSLVSFNCVVINHQKGKDESASNPSLGFGELNDNTIKGLTSLLNVEQEIKYIAYT